MHKQQAYSNSNFTLPAPFPDGSKVFPQFSINFNEHAIAYPEYAVMLANASKSSHVILLNEELRINEIYDYRQDFFEMIQDNREGLHRVTMSTSEDPLKPFMEFVKEAMKEPNKKLFEIPFTLEELNVPIKR